MWMPCIALTALAMWSAVPGSGTAAVDLQTPVVENAASTKAPSQGHAPIPLVGWWGPPPSDHQYALYRQAFLNLVPMTLDEARQATLDTAERRGLSVMLVLPPDIPIDEESIPAEVREHPAVTACLVAEHVTPEAAPGVAARAGLLRKLQPNWTPITTMSPMGNTPAAMDAWREAARLLALARIPVLPMLLPFAVDDTTDEQSLYRTLREAKAAASAGGAPLWGMVQVTEHGDRRRASESDMRLQAYASLAHGAQGLAFFTYWGPPVGFLEPDDPLADFGISMVDVARGVPSYGHEMARLINAEITGMAETLARLTHTGTHFVGDVPIGASAHEGTNSPITRIESPRALAGFFHDQDGHDWVLLVNRQHGARRSARTQSRTMRIWVREGLNSVHAIEAATGFEVPVPLDEARSFTVTIPGGTGTLLRLAP